MLDKSVIANCLKNVEILKEYPDTGQKKVFLIRNNEFDHVIVKIVEAGNDRVLREIQIVTENTIPNVPRIYSVEEITIETKKYLVIFEEFIDGITLNEYLISNILSVKHGIELLDTLIKICVKLEEISVVHRDIKPSNIIFGKTGDFYLLDFGIARRLNMESLTLTHMAVGPHTPGYGAPELFQYSKREIDIRADLFSIGVVAFQALTGEHPFLTGDEEDLGEIWYRTRTIVPKCYDLEGDKAKQLIGFIQTLMQKHINRRPPTAIKAREWLNAVLKTVDLRE